MATTDEVLGLVLDGLEMARPGLDILQKFDPAAATEAAVGLTALYEAIVTIRAWLDHGDENVKKALQDQAEATLQKIAAIKFGAQAPQ